MFNRPKLKVIDSNGEMIKAFPNFYNWMDEQKEYLQAEVSASDDSIIEFRLPILTYGSVMGHIYIGIRKENGKFFIYMSAISRKGKKVIGEKHKFSRTKNLKHIIII